MTDEFTAIVVCPDCGAEHAGAAADIPEFCGCGRRIWHPVSTKEER